jgi:hypothetical protein
MLKFMAPASLREQVYGLSDLAESNDLDSDIASLADWLRLGAHGSLATGQHRPGRLKLEPPLQSRASTGVSADIMAGAGGAAGSAPAKQWCEILHISYDTRYQHQRWWSEQPCSVHEIHGSNVDTMHIFARCFIRVYTLIYWLVPKLGCTVFIHVHTVLQQYSCAHTSM